MGIHQIDCMFLDVSRIQEDSRQFRIGEPSGMLVAIAGVARLTQRASAAIERWARRPERVDQLPRIPAR